MGRVFTTSPMLMIPASWPFSTRHDDLLGDQRLGGGIAWSAGEVPLVLVLLALFVQWRRSDQRISTRMDRAADRDDGADLAAYNAKLAKLASFEDR